MPRMGVMNEAIPEEQYERIQRGLPPLPDTAPRPTDFEMPKVQGQIARDKIKPDEVEKVSGVRRVVRNREGVRFIGYDISITTKGDKVISGWMGESDLNWLRDNLRGRMELDNISY